MNPRNNGLVFHEGFRYKTRTKTENENRYLLCTNYRNLQCKASGKLTPTGEIIMLNANHNHAREDDHIVAAAFKKLLKEACLRERGNLKNIYDTIASRNPGAVFVPYNSIRSSMRRWRNTTTPNVPANLGELVETLQMGAWPRYSTCSSGFFFSGSVVVDGHRAVIFGNEVFIRNFADSQYAFIDGTFKAVPRTPGFVQILTVFATCMDHAFPVTHIFMERRTKALYDAVFDHIKINFPNLIKNTVVTDYEVALVESLRSSYPHANLHGCFFHYCQALLRKAKSLGLVRQIQEINEGRLLLKKYYTLALLPARLIIPALELLWDNNPGLHDMFRGMHQYVRRQWVERVTPEHFSVFRQNHRTNNVLESYHRRLNSKLVRHPGVWDLMETLIDIQNTASIELEQLERQGRVFRVAKKYILFNANLNEAWGKLEDGRFTIEDFFRQAVHFVEGLDINLHHWNENFQDEDDVLPVMPNNPLQALFPAQLQILQPIPNTPAHPPPLVYLRAAPPAQPLLPPPLASLHVAIRPVNNAPPLLPQNPHPVAEPPPLIYFHAEQPVLSPILPSPPPAFSLDIDNDPPFLDNFQPQSPARVTTPIPQLPLIEPLDVQPVSPDRPHAPNYLEIQEVQLLSPQLSNSPSPPLPNWNFPPIPEEIGRLFAELGEDENGDENGDENSIGGRWVPEIAPTKFDEESMPAILRCNVCYLNKMQYSMTCGHIFCTSCASTLFNMQNPRCGICREHLTTPPQKIFFV